MASLADLVNQVPGSEMVVGLGHAPAGASKTISKQSRGGGLRNRSALRRFSLESQFVENKYLNPDPEFLLMRVAEIVTLSKIQDALDSTIEISECRFAYTSLHSLIDPLPKHLSCGIPDETRETIQHQNSSAVGRHYSLIYHLPWVEIGFHEGFV